MTQYRIIIHSLHTLGEFLILMKIDAISYYLPETVLSNKDLAKLFPEWDSMATISFIALLDEKFGKSVSADDIKALKSVSDVLKIME